MFDIDWNSETIVVATGEDRYELEATRRGRGGEDGVVTQSFGVVVTVVP
jgi:hypothetical protein